MKLEITGFVDKINGIEPLKNGFRQMIVLHQPPLKDDLDRVKGKDQYYVVWIWSQQQTDKRFLTSKDIRSKKKCTAYLNGERWFNEQYKDFNYNNKLNLVEWLH